jgi:pSer/pThr/pTyr-binding forkhead associated (FHA) protein
MARVHAYFIEGYVGDRRTLRRIPIDRSPFRIGRQSDLALVLDSTGISRLHAEITRDEKRLMVRDLGSTNGTYVNRKRLVGTREIQDGDIVHFADMEFRVALQSVEVSRELFRTRNGIKSLSEDLPAGTRQFQQLLLDSKILAVFQPIINVEAGHVH